MKTKTVILILALLLIIINPPTGISIVILVSIVYKVFEGLYYRSKKFDSLKERTKSYVDDCNELNSHIENLKIPHFGFSQKTYGYSQYKDASRWNYKRPRLKDQIQSSNIYKCSRTVCASSQKQPLKYVCKYFNIKATEQNLEAFEETLNDFEAVEQGKKSLTEEKEKIFASIKKEVPWPIRTFGRKKLDRKLGFNPIDLSTVYFPKYTFRYTSSGGNAALQNDVIMDIENLNQMVEYLNDRIKWKKSVQGQRALMTSTLRRKILERDGFKCQKCEASIAKEPNLLLEVDHIIPLSKGGMTKEDNLQALCWRCNRSKGAKIE